MVVKVKNDPLYLSKALDDINAIINYTAGKTYDEFMADGILIDATMFRLVQMIENINNISNEYKQRHSEIPWGKIIGFRNGLVHEYGKTDYTTVYEIISRDIYELKSLFEKPLLREELITG